MRTSNADVPSVPSTLAEAPNATAPAPASEVATRAAAVATADEGSCSVTTSPKTIRDELADLVARAVREGDLDLATRLIDVVRAQRPTVAVGVVDLAAERARRGEK